MPDQCLQDLKGAGPDYPLEVSGFKTGGNSSSKPALVELIFRESNRTGRNRLITTAHHGNNGRRVTGILVAGLAARDIPGLHRPAAAENGSTVL